MPTRSKRYSLGTKNKTLQYNADGSLTLYAGANVSRQGKGNQLVAGACWDILALYPSLLAGESHPRWHLDATDYREGEVNKPISHPREDTTMRSTFMHSLVAATLRAGIRRRCAGARNHVAARETNVQWRLAGQGDPSSN